MEIKEIELVKKFKTLEAELFEILKTNKLNIDDNESSAVLKKKLKDYIKNLKRAEIIFEQYQNVADEIDSITSTKSKDTKDKTLSEEMSKSVVELREEKGNKTQNSKSQSAKTRENEALNFIKAAAEGKKDKELSFQKRDDEDDEGFEYVTEIIGGKTFVSKKKKTNSRKEM